MRKIDQEFLNDIEDCGEGARFIATLPKKALTDINALIEFCLNNLSEEDVEKANYLPLLLNDSESKMFIESYCDESIEFLHSEHGFSNDNLTVVSEFKNEILETGSVSDLVHQKMINLYRETSFSYDDVYNVLSDFTTLNEFKCDNQSLFLCSTDNLNFFQSVMSSFYKKLKSAEEGAEESNQMTTVNMADPGNVKVDKIAISKNGTAVVRVKVGDNQYKINQFHNEIVNDLVKQTNKVNQIMSTFNDIETMAGRTARRHFKALVEGVPASSLR